MQNRSKYSKKKIKQKTIITILTINVDLIMILINNVSKYLRSAFKAEIISYISNTCIAFQAMKYQNVQKKHQYIYHQYLEIFVTNLS